MDSITIDKLKHLSNTEVIRRLLIKYFLDKGFTESFDRQLYPSLIQDLPFIVPVLSDKVEVVPHAVEINTSTGKAKLGWNMFVLGNHRMYLGETFHNDLMNLARQVQSGLIGISERGPSAARRQTTPRRVITFIARVLGDHDGGYVDLSPPGRPRQPGEQYAAKSALMGAPQQFFSRSGYGT